MRPPWSTPVSGFGERGTQSSRHIMLHELGELLDALPAGAGRRDYAAAIVDENVLGKPTLATRRATRQRLTELYGLDPAVPLFRVLRRLWKFDRRNARGRALLAALARDPLLRLTAPSGLGLAPREELVRAELAEAIGARTGARFNDAVLRKVVGQRGEFLVTGRPPHRADTQGAPHCRTDPGRRRDGALAGRGRGTRWAWPDRLALGRGSGSSRRRAPSARAGGAAPGIDSAERCGQRG